MLPVYLVSALWLGAVFVFSVLHWRMLQDAKLLKEQERKAEQSHKYHPKQGRYLPGRRG